MFACLEPTKASLWNRDITNELLIMVFTTSSFTCKDNKFQHQGLVFPCQDSVTAYLTHHCLIDQAIPKNLFIAIHGTKVMNLYNLWFPHR